MTVQRTFKCVRLLSGEGAIVVISPLSDMTWASFCYGPSLTKVQARTKKRKDGQRFRNGGAKDAFVDNLGFLVLPSYPQMICPGYSLSELLYRGQSKLSTIPDAKMFEQHIQK